MKKLGFTLAEVLIALAIIGVITALVLPQFITKAHYQANASKLSTVVSDYENIFGLMLLNEDKTNLYDTEFGNAYKSGNTTTMKTALEKYTKLARTGSSTAGLGYLSYVGNPLIAPAMAGSTQSTKPNIGTEPSPTLPDPCLQNPCYSPACPNYNGEACKPSSSGSSGSRFSSSLMRSLYARISFMTEDLVTTSPLASALSMTA